MAAIHPKLPSAILLAVKRAGRADARFLPNFGDSLSAFAKNVRTHSCMKVSARYVELRNA